MGTGIAHHDWTEPSARPHTDTDAERRREAAEGRALATRFHSGAAGAAALAAEAVSMPQVHAYTTGTNGIALPEGKKSETEAKTCLQYKMQERTRAT